jgi:hypothetical protein
MLQMMMFTPDCRGRLFADKVSDTEAELDRKGRG